MLNSGGDKYFKTGIQGFDVLLERGLPIGKNILIEGSPGTGKTIFCLHLMNNLCISGRRVLYMSFEESEQSLKEHMQDFGWNPENLINKGYLKLYKKQNVIMRRNYFL